MLDLNLLNPIEKEKIKKVKTYFILKNIAFLFLSATAILTLVIFFTLVLLQNYQQSLSDQIDNEKSIIEQGKSTSTEEAIKELNTQLSQAQAIQDKYVKWTKFFSSFAKIVPSGIQIKTLKLDSETLSFNVTGLAANRQIYLDFQEQLKNFPFLSDITYPISNLEQKEQINFGITGKLTKNIYE